MSFDLRTQQAIQKRAEKRELKKMKDTHRKYDLYLKEKEKGE